MLPRKCLSSPDSFCHICGSFVVKTKRQKITDFVRKAYFTYFGIKLGAQYKTWAPHIVCHTCIEQLQKWSKKTLKSLIFGGSLVDLWCRGNLTPGSKNICHKKLIDPEKRAYLLDLTYINGGWSKAVPLFTACSCLPLYKMILQSCWKNF
ncbi:hypothetical protein T10_4186 [Trichinella papuae]|uniref:Uncharacterized protein n=1 Tax=Trichinella papuae TaxID=268474 RepID=A0A0V1M899_9BILA|nr:hypothetical protein T10_4186 [Trichinella papuae]